MATTSPPSLGTEFLFFISSLATGASQCSFRRQCGRMPPKRMEQLFCSAGCVGFRTTNELFTLKFKHVDAKCYPALFLRSNRSLLMLFRWRFFAFSSLWTRVLVDAGGSRRSLSFIMERKIPLLRLFVGPLARTQWSLTKTKNLFEFGS
ncbi:hypothetical protein Vadar_019841 [Vaccinium darrowii]|uniref:Uncharacterized protein n=1 Tax=Vaccinium darrowii TaxID=229202 RepID=A0ACB7XBI5_9ERIC|nr:hypothetical protein Vadar_019841 [Vaccinium darrowii]